MEGLDATPHERGTGLGKKQITAVGHNENLGAIAIDRALGDIKSSTILAYFAHVVPQRYRRSDRFCDSLLGRGTPNPVHLDSN
jgi:hypothetical protein